MTPYYADPWLTVYAGDCRVVMAAMPEQSVHCVVTSPPYWGLRDYGTATWVGGNEACDHVLGMARGDTERETPGGRGGSFRGGTVQYPDVCGKCGAARVDGQIGLEPTPEAYVETMVAVFREVRRVLRDDGTVWLNLGDSYASGEVGRHDNGSLPSSGPAMTGLQKPRGERRIAQRTGLKPKDLVGIPWRTAFALQADGWYLRSDVVWSKPNPMPESVTDRPTKSHEYVFLLSKRERYYFDADAVREPHARLWDAGNGGNLQPGRDYAAEQGDPISGGAGKRIAYPLPNPAGRNLRSVWNIATQPYPGAHFATFPEALVEPCVKAGTSERGVCSECGAPWVRVVETERVDIPGGSTMANYTSPKGTVAGDTPRSPSPVRYARETTSTGWRPSCDHRPQWEFEDDWKAIPPVVPATVLDIFAGSGTTGRVAQRLGRRAVLIDLNPAYLIQAMVRNRDIPLGLGFGPTEDAA